jgi:hypothetical protein
MTGFRGSRNPKEGSYNWTGGSIGNQNKLYKKILKPTKGSLVKSRIKQHSFSP